MTTTELAPLPMGSGMEPAAVTVRGPGKRFGGRAVLDGIDLDVRCAGRTSSRWTSACRAWTAATERMAGVRVLVLTTHDTDADIVRAVEAGATGYLLKDTPLPQLADAVRAAARGETVLTSPVVSRMRAPAVDAPTPRGLEVLAGVARGLTNAEIGRELFIGEATVRRTC